MEFRNENERVACRALFLAYESAGPPMGMGFLQAREGATEAEVWANAMHSGDYPGNWKDSVREEEALYLHADYVFGRCMKLNMRITAESIEVLGGDCWRPDYQRFCGVYPNGDFLLKAARESLAREVQP